MTEKTLPSSKDRKGTRASRMTMVRRIRSFDPRILTVAPALGRRLACEYMVVFSGPRLLMIECPKLQIVLR